MAHAWPFRTQAPTGLTDPQDCFVDVAGRPDVAVLHQTTSSMALKSCTCVAPDAPQDLLPKGKKEKKKKDGDKKKKK